MRDVNRLYGFYNTLMNLHMEIFPDWRVGQLISNFEEWLLNNKGIDNIFYIKDDSLLEYVNEFVEAMIK